MKTFKCLIISSNGSCHFAKSKALSSNKLIVFRKHDDKNFIFNQKKEQIVVDSKRFSSYKKKYLK